VRLHFMNACVCVSWSRELEDKLISIVVWSGRRSFF
jgi:hypothetical protein